MTSTLQRQLAALAAPSSSLLVVDRRRSSILFTPQEAAKYDRETFYQIGLDGLNEMMTINPDLFVPFRHSMLFSESSKTLERVVEDRDANQRLDEVIQEFLITISPYLMLKASLKCLEWLVYRFHIEKFNIEPILACILPYGDTKSFVLIIQILEIEKFQDNLEWKWITPFVISASTLRKATLFDNANTQFILWLFSTLQKYTKVHINHQENLRVYVAFMTSTIVGILNKQKRDFSRKIRHVNNRKSLVHTLASQIQKLLIKINDEDVQLKSNEEIHSMMYISLAMLHVSAQHIPGLPEVFCWKLNSIMKLILKSHPPSQQTEVYLMANIMVVYLGEANWEFSVPRIFYKTINAISQVSEDWDLFNLTSKLIISNAAQKNYLNPTKILQLFENIEMNPHQRSLILRQVYRIYKSESKLRLWAKSFLTKFERQFPVEFDIASKEDEQFATDLADYKTGENFALLSQHPDAQIRARAVKRLFQRATRAPEIVKTKNQKKKRQGKNPSLIVPSKKTVIRTKVIVPDENSTAQLLWPRFTDDDTAVVVALLKPKLVSLQKVFTIKTIFERLTAVIKRKANFKCLRLALKKLCSIAKSLTVENEEQKAEIFATLLPFLFPSKPSGVKIARNILQTAFAKEDKLLHLYSQVIVDEHMTPDQVSHISYDLVSKMEGVAYAVLKIEPISLLQTVFACLTANRTEYFHKIMDAVEKFRCTACSGYPVTKENFNECVYVGQKKNKLSLELVLTWISKMQIKDNDQVERVIKFVWQSCEELNNRNVCMRFLKEFFKIRFAKQEEELNFWCYMLLQYGRQASTSEYFVIRTLQFLSAFIQKSFLVSKSSETLEPADDSIVHNLRSHSSQLMISPKKISPKKQNRIHDSSLIGWPLLEILLTQCIKHDSHNVRLWGLNCFEVIIDGDSNINEDIKAFVRQLLLYRVEILTDKDQLSVVVGRILTNTDFTAVLNRFISTIKNCKTERVVTLELLDFCKKTGPEIFIQLSDFTKEILATNPESEILLALLDCFDGSLKADSIIIDSLKHKEPGKRVLTRLTRGIFEQYDLTSKRKLFCILVDAVLHCELPEIKVAIQRCVRKWVLDAVVVAHELVKCIGMQKRNSMILTTSGNAAIVKRKLSPKSDNKKRNNSKTVDDVSTDADWTARTEIVLEFIQGKKKLKNKNKLIVPVFRILKTCILLEEQSPVEYLKQLVLTALTTCCQDEEEAESSEPNDWRYFNVDTVIDCLRCSRNPQTHHHALILLNYAAKRFPEQVLHGVMSLFTFMGNSILRQDDTYSTQLIQQTVTTIIPTLANTGKGNVRRLSTNLVSAGIFRVFTSAVQDIPVHRRLPVFTSLVETLDPYDSMWQVCIIIVDNALNRDKKRSNLNADLDLATDLVWNFAPDVVLQTVEKVYMYLASLPIYDKELTAEEFVKRRNGQEGMSKSVLDFSRKECFRDVQLVVLFTLELVSKVCSKFEQFDDRKLKYDSLIEKCLPYSRLVSSIHDDKIFRLIAHRNFEIIEKINAALEPTDFVRVVTSILNKDDINIRRKMMDMLNQRILQKLEWFGDLKILLDLLPPLVEIAGVNPETDEKISLIQTAFLSLKLIAKNLALIYPEELVPVFELSFTYTTHKNRLLCASALLCMGELFCLKSLILPNLSGVTSSILKAFKSSAKLELKGIKLLNEINQETKEEIKEAEREGRDTDSDYSSMTANLLCISTMTCLNKMTEQLGSFIGSKFLQKALIAVLTIDGRFGKGEKADNRKKVFDQRLKTLLKSIATKIPLRNSLLPIQGAFEKLIDQPRAITSLLGMLKLTLIATARPDFNVIMPSLCEAFLQDFLAYREKAGQSIKESICNGEIVNFEDSKQICTEEVNKVEDVVVDCLITGIVLKMSEGHFRPFYHKIFDWAGDSLSRLITFYRFSAAATERLKSLFVTFAGYVINQTVSSLSKDVELTQAILKFLLHIFSNDREGFITIDRFNALVKPIVDLIESESVISGQISIKEINNTLIQLAVATNDLNRWQHLIELISYKSQHSSAVVRLSVISTLEAAANELGKDFLPLLPPAVPFLAELMGDDDPNVEAETQKMLLKLENIVGEPLQPYFTT